MGDGSMSDVKYPVILVLCDVSEAVVRVEPDRQVVLGAGDVFALVEAFADDITAIAVCNRPINASFIEALPHLKRIACYGTEKGKVDEVAAAAHGIEVTYTPMRW